VYSALNLRVQLNFNNLPPEQKQNENQPNEKTETDNDTGNSASIARRSATDWLRDAS